MSKICISSCVDNERSPVRATYVNLYKWPESDAEFVLGGARLHSRVTDSISCRQMYLRSYTFSREERLLEKTLKCLGKVREMVASERKLRWRVVMMQVKDFSAAALMKCLGKVREMVAAERKLRWRVVTMEVKEFSAAAFRAIFRRLGSCATPVDLEKLDF